MQGLSLEDVAILNGIKDQEQLQELFTTANHIKDTIYGNRLVMFAPLYITNLCKNECTYCAFRAKNKAIVRKALTQEEIKRETQALIKQGHKRVLLVAGESYPKQGFQYVLDSVRSVYEARYNDADIRRVNVIQLKNPALPLLTLQCRGDRHTNNFVLSRIAFSYNFV